jgi:CHAT domain-containing protein
MHFLRCLVPATAFLLPFTIASQELDGTAVVLLADRVHIALHQKDIEGLGKLWTAESANTKAALDGLRKLIDSGELADQRTTGNAVIEGNRARLRVERVLKTSAMPVQLTMEFSKENGSWKVSNISPAEQELAVRAARIRSDEDRRRMLQAEAELLNQQFADALIYQGATASNRGDDVLARSLYQHALEVAQASDKDRAQAMTNIGITYLNEGQLQLALEWMRKGLTLRESIRDEIGIANSLTNMAAVYGDYDESVRAQQFLEQAIALGEKHKNARALATARGALAINFAKRGDYARALGLFRNSFLMAEEAKSERGAIIDLLNMANLFLYQNDAAQAKHHYELALARADKAGMGRFSAHAVLGLGQVAHFQGDLNGAASLLEKARGMFVNFRDTPAASLALAFRASVESSAGNHERAIELLSESVTSQTDLQGSPELPMTHARLAEVHNRAGDADAALRSAKTAIELARPREHREALWRGRQEAGKAYRKLNLNTKAESEFALAISVIEELRDTVAGAEAERQAFFENKLEAYHQMIALQVDRDRREQALSYAEQAKARVLIDVLKSGRGEIRSILTPEERQLEQDQRLRLASANSAITRERMQRNPDPKKLVTLARALNEARIEYSALQTSLSTAHPQWRLGKGEVETFTLRDAAELLPDAHSAAVEFVVTDESVYLLVITIDGQREGHISVFSSAISREALAKRIRTFRELLGRRDLLFRREAADLYRLLLGPAAHLLEGKTNLLIVPDACLWEVPFQALLSKPGRYMLDEHVITYAPSLSAVRMMREAKRQRRNSKGEWTFFAMGNPAWDATVRGSKSLFRDLELGNLPEAEAEVKRSAAVYGGGAVFFTGPEAVESRFKSGAISAKVVHLATHGLINDVSPLFSNVLLGAEQGKEDGLLEAWELLRMQLNAELVVLSACETARGRAAAGEGIIGLSWALFVAGVPSTVMSQWKVRSESTGDLMVAFHANRANRAKKMTDAAALRAAALKLRRASRTNHPFYWAPFIIIGAGY